MVGQTLGFMADQIAAAEVVTADLPLAPDPDVGAYLSGLAMSSRACQLTSRVITSVPVRLRVRQLAAGLSRTR
jgi:hypothetical protein